MVLKLPTTLIFTPTNTGMTVDWMSGRLFWTDSALGTINVVSTEPNNTQTTGVLYDGLKSPAGITADPRYW